MKSLILTFALYIVGFIVSFGQVIYIQGNNPTCNGGGDGSMELIFPLGFPQGTNIVYPIFLTWSNGSHGFSITDLSSGNYSVTLTDGNGIEYVYYQTLFDPIQPTIDSSVTNPSTFTSFDGSLLVNSIQSPYNLTYTHQWNTGDTSLIISGLQAGAYYLSVTDNFGCNTVFHFSLQPAPPITQEIVFTGGWHLFSINKILTSTNLDTVLNDIKENLLILKSFNGQVWVPQFNINQLVNYDSSLGYQVKLAADDTLRVAGNQIDPTTIPIPLQASWNIIPYLRYLNGNASFVLSSLLTNGNLIIMKDEYGNVFWPQFNVNTIGELTAGSAYFLKLNFNQSFQYPANKFY